MCLTHHLWEGLSDQIHKFLSNISLADLVTKREIEQIARSQKERMQIVVANDLNDTNPAESLERIAASSL
jgi:Rrf2 family iron-sulfur cluster assembly transcriptional regulator